jgi:nucleoid-associated protein YgaU
MFRFGERVSMPSQTATIWAAAAGAAAVAAGAALYVWQPGFLFPAPVPAAVSESAPAGAAEGPANAAAVAPATKAASPAALTAGLAPNQPAFDVVNVEPTGESVVAGRAAPNAKVELRDAGKTLALATADSAGQFVIIPPTLAPGDHSLTLATGAGQSAAETSSAIAVAVPEPTPKTVAAAAAPSKDGATPAPAAADPVPSAKIAVKSVEASAGGGMVAKGGASPNGTVRLYLSGAYVGDAKTSADGRWSLTVQHGMTPGAYAVRADEINPADASVVARAEAPFEFPAAPRAAAAPPAIVVASADDRAQPPVGATADVVVESVQTHHVERGHTLWGISQKYYGDGTRYELIFAANANQIRDPHWIYPGQMFVVPKARPKP